MKTIGLLGGMSWESTAVYYQELNREVQKQLGGLHSAQCILYSVDFAEIAKLQKENRWEEAGEILHHAAIKLENAGSELIILCTNTMHIVSEKIITGISVPFLHIADVTGTSIQQKGIRKIGLLGTKFTMEQNFYKKRLIENYDLDILTPSEEDREIVHSIIFDELCRGIIDPISKNEMFRIIEDCKHRGVEGIILGCTEIGLLIKQVDIPLPLFDTTVLHVKEAVRFALEI